MYTVYCTKPLKSSVELFGKSTDFTFVFTGCRNSFMGIGLSLLDQAKL